MKKCVPVFLLMVSVTAFSQCIVPFQDINNFVYLFDAGQSNYIENLPLRSVKVGRNNIVAYVGQNNRMKVYYKGRTFPISDVAPNYYMTDNWFLYQNFNVIKVLYKNEFQTIENFFREGIDSLYYSDSLIVWNNVLNELNLFYNGTTTILERTEVTRAKIGDNIFAYLDRNGNFKVIYRGEMQVLETYEPVNFWVNRDMLMYIDQYNNLKFFDHGVVRESSIQTPREFYTGEGFAAYITLLKQLVVYYNGEETVLMNDRPVDLTVKENLMVYTDKGKNFWCWYKGKKYWLERYIPLDYVVDNDIIVYQDINGRLKAFYFGEQVEVSDQIVKKFTLWNEAVSYSIQPYQTKIWCNKKTFTFE